MIWPIPPTWAPCRVNMRVSVPQLPHTSSCDQEGSHLWVLGRIACRLICLDHQDHPIPPNKPCLASPWPDLPKLPSSNLCLSSWNIFLVTYFLAHHVPSFDHIRCHRYLSFVSLAWIQYFNLNLPQSMSYLSPNLTFSVDGVIHDQCSSSWHDGDHEKMVKMMVMMVVMVVVMIMLMAFNNQSPISRLPKIGIPSCL